MLSPEGPVNIRGCTLITTAFIALDKTGAGDRKYIFSGAVVKHQLALNFQILINFSKNYLANITILPKEFLKKFLQNLKIYI